MLNLLPALIAIVLLQTAQAAWREVPMPPGMSRFGKVVVGPGANLYSFRYGTVWHSTDRGATFQRSGMSVKFSGETVDTNSLTIHSALVAPSGSLFQSLHSSGARERTAIVRSRDHGKTWTSVGDAEGIVGSRLFASPKGEIYAADVFAYEYDHDTVWISRNDGDTWSQAGVFERIMSMAVDPDGSVFVIGYQVGEVQRNGRYNLFKTTDGGARWDSLGSYEGSGGEPFLAANRKGCLAIAWTRGLWTSTPSAPTLALAADSAYLGSKSTMAFGPQHRLVVAVDDFGVLELAPPYASHASLNAGLGMDSTGDFRDLQYDDQDNLYMTVHPPVSNDVLLYVLKASDAGIRPAARRWPGHSVSRSHDLAGRRLPAEARARIWKTGFQPR